MSASSPIKSSASNSPMAKPSSTNNQQSAALPQCPFRPKPFLKLTFQEPTLRASRNEDKLQYLNRELSVLRLNKIAKYLWIAGSGRVRALHHQKVTGREIIVTELVDLHLCWQMSRIYIKPLPRFLLDFEFFTDNLCTTHKIGKGEWTLYASACSFLQSYTQLIVHQSDFLIARELNLIPEELIWDEWRKFAAEVDKFIHEGIKDQPTLVTPRYKFGELRIQRLNLIYNVRKGKSRGFYYSYTNYDTFFKAKFGWMLLAFAYFSIVLAALQTALTTSAAEENHILHNSAYWFGVVVLLLISGSTVALVLLFVGMVVDNLIYALKEKRKKIKQSSCASIV